jgi:4-amino-4-deoxy-L-arabinose transferase-like glycosyltransferase
VCALVAVLNATAWSLVTPAFQVPDEQSHYAYTEYLIQHWQPPRTHGADSLSTSEEIALVALDSEGIRFQPTFPTIWSATEQRHLQRGLAAHASRSDGNGAAREVGGEPPLFYALQAIPYQLGSGGSVLDRLALMRLLSALIGGVTVLFVFLFLREALPESPRTWTVGALGVAFQPLFAFMTSGVNSDVLLYASSAALFYLLARAFRRGLTRRLAIATGVALAVGLMTKFNAAGLLPGAMLGLTVIAVRQEGWRFGALRLPAIAFAVAIAPELLELALNAIAWDRPLIGATAGNFSTTGIHLSIGLLARYIWQFYGIRLPGASHTLTTPFPLRDLWFRGLIGSYGYVETEFRDRVYELAAIPAAVVCLLAARALYVLRADARKRLLELLIYAAVAAGLMLFVGVASYVLWAHTGASIAQTRYLLPLLPLYGALLALAARGAGPRWLPVVGTTIVVLAIAHDVFSQLLVLSRYYA